MTDSGGHAAVLTGDSNRIDNRYAPATPQTSTPRHATHMRAMCLLLPELTVTASFYGSFLSSQHD